MYMRTNANTHFLLIGSTYANYFYMRSDYMLDLYIRMHPHCPYINTCPYSLMAINFPFHACISSYNNSIITHMYVQVKAHNFFILMYIKNLHTFRSLCSLIICSAPSTSLANSPAAMSLPIPSIHNN